ncbi:MAG: enoyl-CoA hydratase/isomerase family protein [Rudaea sp.]|nr:enoyl-CoA hydratase/isomerase family protein [Rudaea sp.]
MPLAPSDLLGADALAPLEGGALLLLDTAAVPARTNGAIRVLVDRTGDLPDVDPDDFDALVTTRSDAPTPWVAVTAARLEGQLDRVRAGAAHAPIAASMLARILRIGADLPFADALELESLAYSTLLGGGEFAAWLRSRASFAAGGQDLPPVRYEREDDIVTLVLASPTNRNAMTAVMRDALFEGLANVVEDPSEPGLIVRGDGACFSVGGDLAEFGTASDLAAAHIIRTMRSPAALLHRLGERAEVQVHGACIGSGIEIAAAASRRIAAPGSFVQLPELAMGLIPGAGGTVSVAGAIGRHRLMWLALGNFRFGAEQALRWGLFHAIRN